MRRERYAEENKEQCEQLHPRECVCFTCGDDNKRKNKKQHFPLLLSALLCSSLFLFSSCDARFHSAKLSFLIHFIFLQFALIPLFLLLDLSYAAYHGEFGPHLFLSRGGIISKHLLKIQKDTSAEPNPNRERGRAKEIKKLAES
jgi:hypothetical protein